MKKKRLDIRCVELNLFESRQKAQRAILAGDVMVNGIVRDDASFCVSDDDRIEVKNKMPYVSRGGLKLKAAIDHFNIVLKGKICLDVGVSTGGFSDCMLKEGAAKVYGVDVGRGQIHEKVLSDDRFVFMPNTNARYLKPEMFDTLFDFVGVDVSFISLKLIVEPVLSVMKNDSFGVFLLKPQFELSRTHLRKGVVKDDEARKKALYGVVEFMENLGYVKVCGYMDCPIEGVEGNREFLVYISKTSL